MQKTIIRDTRTSVVLWANWFQFAAAERAFNPRVLSRMLLWCQEGKGRVRVNGIWYAMQPDDFLFLPWQHEVLYVADGHEPFWVGGIHIIPDYAMDRKLVFSVSHSIKGGWAKCSWRRDRAWPELNGVCAGCEIAGPAAVAGGLHRRTVRGRGDAGGNVAELISGVGGGNRADGGAKKSGASGQRCGSPGAGTS